MLQILLWNGLVWSLLNVITLYISRGCPGRLVLILRGERGIVGLGSWVDRRFICTDGSSRDVAVSLSSIYRNH
jgi:hypothetical protein